MDLDIFNRQTMNRVCGMIKVEIRSSRENKKKQERNLKKKCLGIYFTSNVDEEQNRTAIKDEHRMTGTKFKAGNVWWKMSFIIQIYTTWEQAL